MVLPMNIFASRKQRREVKRAKVKSDEIDSQLEEAKRRRQHHDVLLISPSFPFTISAAVCANLRFLDRCPWRRSGSVRYGQAYESRPR
jgi:hypothetical protein